jgi:hypothetical protein
VATDQIQTACARMIAANKAVKDSIETEPFSMEMVKALLADSIKATDDYAAALDEYMMANGPTPARV